jgi:hypothetical protein
MPERDHYDQEDSIINGVKNSILPYSESVTVATTKRT